MCIISAKAIGIDLPTPNTIERMWQKNPDGAGFMYAHNGKVVIRKGFMRLQDFTTALQEVSAKIDVLNTAMVLHFRIGTSGGNIPQNTHPFPVTDKLPLLQQLSTTCELGMAHNGILSITPRTGISDTMEYVLTIASSLKHLNKKFYKMQNGKKIIEQTIDGDRMVFLNGEGGLFYMGNWVEDKETGLMYSNSGFKSYKYDSLWDDIFTTGFNGYIEKKSLFLLDDTYQIKLHDGTYMSPDDFFAATMADTSGNCYFYDYDNDLAIKMEDTVVESVGSSHLKYDEQDLFIYDCTDKYDYYTNYDGGYEEAYKNSKYDL